MPSLSPPKYNLRMEASVPDIVLVPFSREYRQQVVELWMETFARPRSFVEKDLDLVSSRGKNLLVLAVEGSTVLGTMIAACDGYRGWVYYLSVHPEHRNKGIARMLMQEGERRLQDWGCGTVHLHVHRANSDVCKFYSRMGFGTDDGIMMIKHLRPGG